MRRGVVIEVNERFVTILTPCGQFMKAENVRGSYELGEEVTFVPVEEVSRSANRRLKVGFRSWKAKVSVAIALILVFLIGLPSIQNGDVYAYMTIDINPSFELELDADLHVIDIEPLNDEAKTVLNKLKNWKDQSFQQVTDDIIEVTEDQGYLNNEQEIIIATVVNDDKGTNETIKKEIEKMKKSLTKKDIKITAIESDMKTRKEAKKEGVSTGKYLKEKKQMNHSKSADQKKETVSKEETPSKVDDVPKQAQGTEKVEETLNKNENKKQQEEQVHDKKALGDKEKDKDQEKQKEEKEQEEKIDNIDDATKHWDEQKEKWRKEMKAHQQKIEEKMKKNKEYKKEDIKQLQERIEKIEREFEKKITRKELEKFKEEWKHVHQDSLRELENYLKDN